MKAFGKWIRRHKFLTALVILLAIVTIAVVVAPKAKVTYSEETVALRDIVTYNSFVGNMQPVSETTVVAKASDFVKTVYVKEGDEVKKGDLLAVLDTDTLDYTIWKAEKNLAIAESTFEYNYDTAPTTPYADFLDDTTGESLKISAKDLERLKETRKDYEIYAPADGIITFLNLTEGATVATGMTVATISDISSLQISIRIDEYSILHAKEGLPVTIYVDSTGKTYDGKLAKIAKIATVQGGVSYFSATVEFVADEDAHSGVSAEVRLIKTNEQKVPTVSAGAIWYREDNTPYVLLKGEDGEPVERDITIGASDGKYVQILSGISVGDVILYTPTIDFPMVFTTGRGEK